MFNKSKYCKPLALLFSTVLLIFSCVIPSYAESVQTFKSAELEYKCVVYDEQGNSVDVTSDTKVYPNVERLYKTCTRFIFPQQSGYSSKQVTMFKLRKLSSLHEYNLIFSLLFQSGVRSYSVSLEYRSPNGDLITSQELLNSNTPSGSSVWVDYDFNFVPLEISGQAYSLYLVFNFDCNNSSTNIFYMSEDIVLVDTDDNTPFYTSVLNWLEKIDKDILDLNSKFIELNTNFGDFLTDFLNFSDSFKLSINDLIDFTDNFNTNLTDILDLSFDNFFSHIFSDINISLGLINNSVNNSNNSVNETLNNIDNSITNIDNSISQIGSTLDEISSNVSQGFEELIQGEEVNQSDFSTEGTDSINNISDELESAESQLPQLTEDDLKDKFDLSILSDLNKGFIALNNVFDLVTSSLGFTSVLIFLMGFGLAVYIIGRRLGS